MKKIGKIMLLVISLASLVSCHKYPGDPFISFRRPFKRLEGSGSGVPWRFSAYQINGADHSHDFDQLLKPNTLSDCILMLTDNEDNQVYWISADNANRLVMSDYGISSDNKTLFLDADLSAVTTTYNNFFVQVFKPTQIDSTHWNIPHWKIVELYGQNLHISNNGIDIYFKKE